MSKPFLATIVNFCSNEARFFPYCIEQARQFSQQIIVPVCDHFFDGTPERRDVLEKIYAAFPDCQFIEYPYLPKKIPARVLRNTSINHFWHSLSRFVGASVLDESIETVLFLDADEVPEGERVASWLQESDYRQHLVLKFANYWYFREPRYQALHWEDSAVLVQRRALDAERLLHEKEREALYDLLPGPKRRAVTDQEGRPMFHHFSWVRTQEEMLRKVEAWGHRGDRNWKELVNQEFSLPFRGTDFVHGYSYRTVEPPFPISLGDIVLPQPNGKPTYTRMEPRELLQLLDSESSMWDYWDMARDLAKRVWPRL
jgi:hypothetical protein